MTTPNIDSPTAINSKISPIPCRDWLTLDLGTKSFQGYHFKIFNLEGQMLQRCPLSGRCTSINLSNLTPSTYILEVMKGEQRIAKHKFIKE